jgi:hypothetical protein
MSYSNLKLNAGNIVYVNIIFKSCLKTVKYLCETRTNDHSQFYQCCVSRNLFYITLRILFTSSKIFYITKNGRHGVQKYNFVHDLNVLSV